MAAPGRIETPPAEWVISEFERLKRWAQALPAGAGARVKLVPPDPRAGAVPAGSEAALQGLLEPLAEGAVVAAVSGAVPKRRERHPMPSGSSDAWCATSKGRCRTSCESRTESGTNAI